jgi:Ca-activated chloride channel homolog
MVQPGTKHLLVCIALSLVTLTVGGLLIPCLSDSHNSFGTRAQTKKSQRTNKQGPGKQPAKTDELGEPPPIPKFRPRPEEDVNPGEVISVNTTEVMLPVIVKDSTGRLVNNLSRTDFHVFEDSSEQPLSDIALRQVPVDAVLMVDASSSVASNLDDFRRAAEGFAARLAQEDRISLIKFDDRVELLQDWTQSRFQLRRALNRIQPGMFTRFNDAIMLAARDQFVSGKSRRAVIVLSDGIDSGRGTTSLEVALQALLKAQVTTYVVSNTEISRATKRAELDQLLGGSETTIRFKFDALDSIYAEVADELRHQYALYYTPLNKVRDGGFRRVRVQMKNSSLDATTRIGYFAPKS